MILPIYVIPQKLLPTIQLLSERFEDMPDANKTIYFDLECPIHRNPEGENIQESEYY